MDDPRFAAAVKATGRHKLILSGITTDFCLVYPALSLIAAGFHVFIPIDASGSWTSAINDAAIQRAQGELEGLCTAILGDTGASTGIATTPPGARPLAPSARPSKPCGTTRCGG